MAIHTYIQYFHSYWACLFQEDQIADAMAEKTAAAEAAQEQLEKVGPAESWELLDPKTLSVTEEAWDASDDGTSLAFYSAAIN